MYFQHKIKIKQGLANRGSLETYGKRNLSSTNPTTTTQLSSGCEMLGLFPWSLILGFSEEMTQDSGPITT